MDMSKFMNRSTAYLNRGVGDESNSWLFEEEKTSDPRDTGNTFLNFSDLSVYNYSDEKNGTSSIHENALGWTDFALVFLFCSVIAGTVVGNTLVIAAVVTTRRLRTVTNCFVMSLAVADWLVGMFVMPLKVGLHLVGNKWHLGRILCELWISLDILLCTASILSLCAISIDRYLAITRPLAYSRKRRSKRLALSMISCVWVAAVVITSPPIFGWYDSNRNVDLTCDYNENKGYVVYSALGSFFLPLLVMLYVYAKIACVISHRQRTIEKMHQNTPRKCCEDPDGGKEDSAPRGLESMDEHNRIERSSSSSASHTIPVPVPTPQSHSHSHSERDSSMWKRFHFKNYCLKSIGSSTKSDRGKPKEHRRDTLRSNTIKKKLSENTEWTRTGSRLCHHSTSTLSPQRSFHRIQTPSVGLISFSDGDLTIGENKREGSRVWTIEGSEQPSLHSQSQSFKLNGRIRTFSEDEDEPCDNSRINESSMSELHSRVYPSQSHRAGLQTLHVHHHGGGGGGGGGHSIGSTSGNSLQIQAIPIQRRSIKSNLSMRVSSSSDPNQNSTSAAAAREFTSGRIASFKRETKTAQTLAAVVGGFIICWLPFFVAYVIGPFIPDEDKIPVPLMDALIWLGWGNSAINPFIYAFYSPDFRSAFWRLTIRKFEGFLRARHGHHDDRNSPRRYDDVNHAGLRLST